MYWESLTWLMYGYMDWPIIGSQSCNNKTIEIWSFGKGVAWRFWETTGVGESRGVSSSTMVTVIRESIQDEGERKGSGLKQGHLTCQSLRSLMLAFPLTCGKKLDRQGSNSA